MSKFDQMRQFGGQAGLAMKLQKVQKQLKKEVVEVSAGDGAVVVKVNGELKLRDISIDKDKIDLENIAQLEDWLETALKDAFSRAQEMAADKMKPFMGQLGQLGM